MKPTRIIMAGTMAVVISFSVVLGSKETKASSIGSTTAAQTVHIPAQDPFLQTLGAQSDEEIYDALYGGQTLAEIAEDHQKDVQPIIDLQVAQLSEQLNLRLATGSISLEQYNAQQEELAEIVTRSVYGLDGLGKESS
jgi:hypothetical protein